MNIIKNILALFCTSFLLVTAQAFSCVVPTIGGPPAYQHLSCSDAVISAFTPWLSFNNGVADAQSFNFNGYVNNVYPAATIPYSAANMPPLGNLNASFSTASSGTDMRLYFLGRSAGYVNSLGIIDETTGTWTYAFSPVDAPLPNVGDMVDFAMTPGDTYCLFLKNQSDPVNYFDSDASWGNPYTTNDFQHFLLLTPVIPDLGPYFADRTNYVVGVEDEPAGFSDFDYNDCTFLLSIGPAGSCNVPEPGTWAICGSLLALALVIARKRQIA